MLMLEQNYRKIKGSEADAEPKLKQKTLMPNQN
jgi:hypothetical protein